MEVLILGLIRVILTFSSITNRRDYRLRITHCKLTTCGDPVVVDARRLNETDQIGVHGSLRSSGCTDIAVGSLLQMKSD